LNIAAAADLQYALPDLIQKFSQSHPDVDVKATYGASGTFVAQISNGSPFDLFLSADLAYPQAVVANGYGAKGSVFTYAIGHLVLWTPQGGKLDAAKMKMKLLEDPSFNKLAIAKPETAPYGRAAEAALKTYKLWTPLQAKLVMGDNVAQAAQFAHSATVDAAMISQALALSPAMKSAGSYFVVPQEDYPSIEQGGVVVTKAADAAVAREFVQFLTSAPGQAVLKNYGFGLPVSK
jgi:molybdate transport system substrate-binding protein